MPEPLSAKELADISERCEKATPGPWRVRLWGGTNQESPEPPEWTIEGPGGYRIRAEDVYPGNGDDVYFLAHAREDVPKLLEALRVAYAEIDRRLRAGETP